MTEPTQITHVFETLLDAATKVGLAAAALFLAWAGFLYMTASGSPRRMESAKDAAFAAIGGLAVVLLAHTIAGLVSNAITTGPPPTP
jgi:Type IV secretion system pilin